MRAYLPATSTLLARLHADGELGPAPLTAFAVTAGLREWYVDDEIEELEYAALSEAARASLRLLDAEQDAARRRVVLALDAPEESVEVRDDLDRGVVHLHSPVGLGQLASIHVDDRDAEETVASAARSVVAADLGDPAAEERVGDADGFELSWYAPQELGELLDSL